MGHMLGLVIISPEVPDMLQEIERMVIANPENEIDWWQCGGSYDGIIKGKITKIDENEPESNKLDNNLVTVGEIYTGFLPHLLFLPNNQEVFIQDADHWKEVYNSIQKEYPHYFAVALDVHL